VRLRACDRIVPDQVLFQRGVTHGDGIELDRFPNRFRKADTANVGKFLHCLVRLLAQTNLKSFR
jgi:hypothetical protein